MVITITCPSCSSAFPVDPAKIPERGVNARCTQCGDVFRVEKPAEAAPEPIMEPLMDLPEPAISEPPPLPEIPVAPELPEVAEMPAVPALDEPALEAPKPPALEPTPEFAAPTGGADPFAQAAPFEEPTPAAPAAPVDSPAAGPPKVQGFTFGKRDPTDKAKRLARVLVSDMIMYNAERHQNALGAGTLVQDFEDEIDKSWKEYVEQVGEEMANGQGRQFWTDALNDILAKGEEVF